MEHEDMNGDVTELNKDQAYSMADGGATKPRELRSILDETDKEKRMELEQLISELNKILEKAGGALDCEHEHVAIKSLREAKQMLDEQFPDD